MKKPYPVPVVFGKVLDNGNVRGCFTRDVASKTQSLFISTPFSLLEKTIIITDSTTYNLLRDSIHTSYVYIWKMDRRAVDPDLRMDLNNYYSVAEEGGWRKLLLEALETADNRGIDAVYVFGETRLMRLVHPYVYDYKFVSVNNNDLWDRMKSDSYDFTMSEDFELIPYPTHSSKADYAVGTVSVYTYGRKLPPKNTVLLREEIK